MYGLTNSQGNHGEDVKECWWYWTPRRRRAGSSGATTTPGQVPLRGATAENARRGRDQPEYELTATGIFEEDRFFVVTVTWAKAAPEDILWQIEVQNVGPDAAPLDVLPRSGSAIAGAGISAPYGRRCALRAGPNKTWPRNA